MITTAIELNSYTKNAIDCKVKITDAFELSLDIPMFKAVSIISTEELVHVGPIMKRTNQNLLVRKYSLGEEFDAVWFYYEGEKVVHIKNSLRYSLRYPIIISLMSAITLIFITLLTIRKIKFAENIMNKEPKDKKWYPHKMRFTSIFYGLSYLVFYIISNSRFRTPPEYSIVFFASFILSSLVITFYDDYYIDLPTDENS